MKSVIASMRALAKSALLRALEATLRRHVVLLPSEAGDEGRLVKARSRYRAERGEVVVELLERDAGTIRITVWAYQATHNMQTLIRTEHVSYLKPATLIVDLRAGQLHLGGALLGTFGQSTSRRYAVLLEWRGESGTEKRRLTSHYVPGDGDVVTAAYYSGDTYVDHEGQALHESSIVRELLVRHGVLGRVLEVGCATGVLLSDLASRGMDVYGVDISEWAVNRANERLRSRRAWICDVDRDELPSEIKSAAPFNCLILWAVYEHFKRPRNTLVRLAALMAPGSFVVINTSNARSLTRAIFREDWEGYFDPSHHGVDAVDVVMLRQDLDSTGFDILSLETEGLWDGCLDPSHAALRDLYGDDSRFRELLRERELGDFIRCVAVKR